MRAVLYARFSPRPDKDECLSCERQLERCTKYCQMMTVTRKSYEICGGYSDEGVSGGVIDRPGLNDALEHLRELDGEKVLVADTASRIARDMLVALGIRHQVERAGGSIEYADGTPPLTTPEGELFNNILAAFASYERSRIRAATSRGIKRRQEAGEHWGKAPVGWERNETGRLIPCESEQEAIQDAMELSELAGIVSANVAEILTARHGQFRGKPWSDRTVRKIVSEYELCDEAYHPKGGLK